ncbi:hypothetical protein [Staphylococcus saprophyticus]|nr:hypothetical protein [Staphylococcus saprophyticus]
MLMKVKEMGRLSETFEGMEMGEKGCEKKINEMMRMMNKNEEDELKKCK